MANLIGTAANDTLVGTASDDTLNGLSGADKLSGGDGKDIIRYTIEAPGFLPLIAGDLITGFEVGKDKIDLRDLFQDFGIASDDPVLEGYLYLQVSGGNTTILFDGDGAAEGFNYVALATLQGVTNASLADIIYPQG